MKFLKSIFIDDCIEEFKYMKQHKDKVVLKISLVIGLYVLASLIENL